jgi:hypothetical protein
MKIKSSADKAFWDETKSFFYNIRAQKQEQKPLGTSFFNHQEDNRCRPPLLPNYAPRGKTVTVAYSTFMRP